MAVLPGCSSGPDEDDEVDWTVFVYGHGDHNLTNSLLTDIVKMRDAKLSGNVRVVVLADWNAAEVVTSTTTAAPLPVAGASFPSGSQWFFVSGNGKIDQVDDADEQNLDDPAVLRAAIERAFTRYPARHRGLVMWDHGGSWYGGFGGDSQNGTTSGTPILAGPLADAIAAGAAAAKLPGDKPFDFLGFDTCLMAGSEVAYTLRNLSKVYIANAELDYGSGWNYGDVLTFLSANPNVSPTDFGKAEVGFWDAQHIKEGKDDELTRSHVALDPSALEGIASASETLAKAIIAAPDLQLEVARRALLSLPGYHADAETSPIAVHYRDFGQFTESLSSAGLGDISTAAAAVQGAIAGAVIAKAEGSLRGHQSGLHVELPLAKNLSPAYLDDYKRKVGAWVDRTKWDIVLAGLYTKNDGSGTTPTVTLGGTTPPTADAPLLASVSTTADDGAFAEAYVWVQGLASNDWTNVGLAGVSALRSGAPQEIPWGGSELLLGADKQLVTFSSWLFSSAGEADVSTLHAQLAVSGKVSSPDGKTSPAKLLFFDGETQASTLVVEDDAGSTSAVDVAGYPGSFVPTIERSVADAPANLEGKPIPFPASGGIPITTVPAPAGTYVIHVVTTDVWGNQGAISSETFTIP